MLRRAVAATGLSLAIVGAAVVPAFGDGGWGSVQCDQNPHPGCELGAGSSGGENGTPRHSGGRSSGSGSTSSGGGSNGDGGGEAPRSSNPNLNLADCSYQRSDYKSPPEAAQTAYEGASGGAAAAVSAVYSPATPSAVVPAADPKPGESGAWYVYKCTADGVRDAVYRPPIWIADTPRNGGAAQPMPAQLAQVARSQLRLRAPQIMANPADEQLVGLPTWLWLVRGEWKAVSATASVPGVSVTAVARPESVVWTTGDGNSVTCKGPGTPYGSGAAAKSASPDCGYTYRTSSAVQPGGVFAVSATVHWTVSWSGAGQTGVFPDMTTASNAEFRVGESQALNNGG
ncbi:hypothetical protein ACFV2H_02375 [Streptomyces sp. NPDC059629]|uniref:hypothetical protein n=1 Tax=Streptomyces sp. NPDC059629 TaxID=3346889 RepID=UPI0036CFCF67